VKKIRTLLYIATLLMLVISASADDGFSKAVPVDNDQPVISTVSLHPDGKLLVTAGDDHVVRVWDLTSGVQIKQLEGHSGWVRSSAFIPKTTQIVTAGDDGNVHLFDVASGELKRKIITVDFAILRVAISPSGKTLALAGFSKDLRLVDIHSGNVIHSIDTQTDDIRAVAFSSAGKVVASGGRDGLIRLWSVDTGRQVGEITAHRRRIRDMRFVAKDSLLVSISDDRTMFVANLEDAAASFRIPLGGVVPFALADCRHDEVAVGGTDNQIAIWNLHKQTVRKVFQGHTGSVTSLDYIPRPDGLGGMVVSGSFDTSVRTWPLGPDNPVRVRVSEQSPSSPK